ncbi:MAG TPA: AAA family ATPase [Microlunatus sp.]|nr:AAA family ATPase [Microlunatus sp.]
MPTALLLIGTVGVGKTTTADAVGLQLEAASVPHAVIDLDEIRRLWPRSASDQSGDEIELRNLASLAVNYFRAGALRLIMAGTCESWSDRRSYESAVAVPLVVCRLHAPLDVLVSRLSDRHSDEPGELDWHLHRAPELDAILDSARIADADVSTDSRTPMDVAADVLSSIGWSSSVGH